VRAAARPLDERLSYGDSQTAKTVTSCGTPSLFVAPITFHPIGTSPALGSGLELCGTLPLTVTGTGTGPTARQPPPPQSRLRRSVR
jgi:hypothetical protein